MKARILHSILLVAVVALVHVGTAQAQAAHSANVGLISCTPAPCVLPPTQASEGGAEVANAPIVSDPLNPMHLLLGANDANCQFDLGAFVSSDGGSSWNRTCFTRGVGLDAPAGLPTVTYDRRGVAYVASVYRHYGYLQGLVAVQSSTDGINWSKPVKALQEGQIPSDAWLAADTNPTSPHVNGLYVSAVVHYANSSRVYVSHSSDGGATWQAVPVAPSQIPPAGDAYTNMTVGKDGTVYLAWMYCDSGPFYFCTNNKGNMVFSKSIDGGNSWSRPTLMATVTLGNGIPNTSVGAENYPAIGVDNSNGPHAGNLYVVMYNWTGTFMQVQVIRSTDGGNTWSKPVPVAPASDTHDQFFPWLSVSPTGLVGVSWLDRRNDPANIDYQAFAAISTDGGQTFPNVQLTTAFSNPNNNGYVNNGWMGDYTGNTWAGPDFVAAWMDSSNGVDMQDVVGGIRLH